MHAAPDCRRNHGYCGLEAAFRENDIGGNALNSSDEGITAPILALRLIVHESAKNTTYVTDGSWTASTDSTGVRPKETLDVTSVAEPESAVGRARNV
jgi:hypothetical protein